MGETRSGRVVRQKTGKRLHQRQRDNLQIETLPGAPTKSEATQNLARNHARPEKQQVLCIVVHIEVIEAEATPNQSWTPVATRLLLPRLS